MMTLILAWIDSHKTNSDFNAQGLYFFIFVGDGICASATYTFAVEIVNVISGC